jgi:two-component system, chemotaxis family, sensor kinase CheA
MLPADSDHDLIVSFVIESREYLQSAEASMLSLETDPGNPEAVNTVFRAFHTIKGTSGFLGLTLIQELAHRAESLLSRIRDRKIRCTGGYADLALRSADELNELVQSVQNALGGESISKPAGYDELMRVLADPEAAGISDDPSEASVPHLRVGDILVAAGKVSREEVESVAASQGRHKIGEALLKSQVSSVTDLAEALRTQRRLDGADLTADSTVRVRTDRLDRLIEMVGELVIAQSMVAQDETLLEGNHHGLLRKIAHAGKIVRELQDLSMSMRMVPLKATFQKMARLVRDLAHKSGKVVEFHTQGEDTEIHRNMVDFIGDPLVHMIRNAIDHGIEAPEVREGHGKSRTGTVRLSAYHADGNIVFELADDGQGLDRNKILKKALEKGLLSSEKALPDSEILALIFAPGFSTADQITDVSGRGVGMDVVRRNIEALRGRIDIASLTGQGSTFTIRLPMTLAITDGMLVRVGQER